ncbi:hypothetical protein THAOC_25158 [Thalassiosira oceanica]|uniref:Uncharacterized protein n=1 Tax=Thalassiosira oceanica TaxID=159749 RepID=K0RN16_THAOC|nr:hypothetical protein THAOC_25158 [Thalassiosira oceanica]|eukprot:EJK55138.1 hypothetical protein THAOC_25158 [Thalassiosira oceanica]
MATGGPQKRKLNDPGAADQDGSQAAEAVPPRLVDVQDIQLLIDERISRAEESMRRYVDALEEANAALKTQVVELKLETEDLRRRCAVNARSIQVLKKDVKWTYSAPDIPRSHWLNQGHGDQYIAAMTKIVKLIKKSTEKLRKGTVNGLTTIYLKSDVFLAHDDILLPHWSELSDAIQIRGEGDLLTFGLINVQVNRSVRDMLTQSLVLKCHRVELIMNRFNAQDGTNFAVGVIQNNPQMNTFRFRMLKTLMSSPARKFVKLLLSRNHIRTNGCSILPDYIASNPPLEVLALNDNHLVDDDLRMISMALKTNDRLKELHLKRNDYTAIGTMWLEVAVLGLRPIQTASGSSFLDPSFDSVFDCNHTCRIYGDPESAFKELNCSSPLENKMRKLYDQFDMHSLRGDLVNELQRSVGGDLISLMPFVLQRIEAIHLRLQTLSIYSLLSILLGLLRNMPEKGQHPPGPPQDPSSRPPAAVQGPPTRRRGCSRLQTSPSSPARRTEPGQHAFAALQNRPFRGRYQVPDFPVVEPPRLADAARQVERAEEHGVHARHRGDLGYRLDALRALDLDHHQQLLPTPGHVVRVGPVAARPHEGERAAPHAVDGIRGVVDLAGVARGRQP